MGHSWSFVFRNRSSEVGSPCRSLAGPSTEVGSPCRGSAGPSSEVGSPCRSLAGPSSEVGSLIYTGGGRPPSIWFDIPFIFALDFVFLHKRNRPFCVTAERLGDQGIMGTVCFIFQNYLSRIGTASFFSRSPYPLPVRGRGGSRGAYCISTPSLLTGPRC